MQPTASSAATYNVFSQNSPTISSEDLDNNNNICEFTRQLAKQQLASEASAVTQVTTKPVYKNTVETPYVRM